MDNIKATASGTSTALSSLLMDLGSHIRYLDPGGEYCEYWMMDGEYIADERWVGIDVVASGSYPEIIGTAVLLGVTSLIVDMLNAISELEKDEEE